MPLHIGQATLDVRELQSEPINSGVQPLRTFAHRPWLAGSSVALLPGETKAVVADTDNHAVVVVDLVRGIVLHRVAVGRLPERLVVSPDGRRVFVTNRGGRSVSVVDPVRGIETMSVPAGVEPFGLALTPDGATLLVAASATHEIVAFDTTRLSIQYRLSLPDPWPAVVAMHPDGDRAYVTTFFGHRVFVMDPHRGTILGEMALPTHDTGLPNRLLTVDPRVRSRDKPSQNKPTLTSRRHFRPHRTGQVRTPNLAISAVVSPGGNRLFVAHTMVDTGAARVAAVAIPNGGYGLPNVADDGPIVSTVSTFDLHTNRLLRPGASPPLHNGPGNTAQTIRKAHEQVKRLAQPVALAHDPAHARLLVVGMGSDEVMALDGSKADPIGTPLGTLRVGKAPKGVAISQDGTRAFVHEAQDFQVAVVRLDRSDHGHVGAKIEIGTDPLPPATARGRRLFTLAGNSKISGSNRFACASCHPDGRQDGLVWHVGAGPRQTMVLTDRVESTGPFNWLGTQSSLTANIHQTVGRLGGSGLSPQEEADLSTYITRYLPGMDNPHRRPATADKRRLVAKGRAIFESDETGCTGCHDPSGRFSDGLAHDVGTTTPLEVSIWQRRKGPRIKRPVEEHSSPPTQQGRSFDFNQVVIAGRPAGPHQAEPLQRPPVHYNTPSLRHLWASAPYFHDGSVASLRDLFTTGNPGDRMGTTSHLSTQDVDALEAYLLSL